MVYRLSFQLKLAGSIGANPAAWEASFHPQTIEMVAESAIAAGAHRIAR
jgi:hydroxyacyl-ACP dehydratase HTD2-like protein with hotdog domain